MMRLSDGPMSADGRANAVHTITESSKTENMIARALHGVSPRDRTNRDGD
jgi:hypothetical protein